MNTTYRNHLLSLPAGAELDYAMSEADLTSEPHYPHRLLMDPSADPTQAFEILLWLAKRDDCDWSTSTRLNTYSTSIWNGFMVRASADTPALAICRACLAWVTRDTTDNASSGEGK